MSKGMPILVFAQAAHGARPPRLFCAVLGQTPRVLSLRLGRALAAIVLACGILGAAAVGQGRYGQLAKGVEAPTALLPRLEEGDLVGRISAPRVGLDAPVYEGIASGTLAQGPGHVPGTALPGTQEETTNALIAVSHSDEGDRLARLRLGDVVEMRTLFGLRRYRVVDRRLLDPTAIRFDAAKHARVTLLTPYPPDELGPAPTRLALALEEDARS
jgi:LPXTG-site transpeptidase (sortase) family protein